MSSLRSGSTLQGRRGGLNLYLHSWMAVGWSLDLYRCQCPNNGSHRGDRIRSRPARRGIPPSI